MIDEHLPSACDARDGRCHLCGDDAVAGRVIEIDERTRTATVQFPESSGMVALDLVDVKVGDDVLVHLGFAIEQVQLHE